MNDVVDTATRLCNMVLLGAVVVAAGPVSAQSEFTVDPLRPHETADATRAALGALDALDTALVAAPLVAGGGAIAPRVFGAERAGSRLELLLVERHQNEKEPGARVRGADVYVYDYSNDTLRHAVVDLDHNALVSLDAVQGVQLPLTDSEIERAFDILLASDADRGAVEREFQRVTGRSFSGRDDVRVKAFAFLSDSKPTGLNAASKRCGVHRCAQLVMATSDDVLLEISPIVDLSAGRVAQRLSNN